MEIRNRYEILLDETCRQKTVLLGSLEEARAGHVCRALETRMVKEKGKKKDLPPSKVEAKTKPLKKKPVELPVPPTTSTEGAFTEVVSKKNGK